MSGNEKRVQLYMSSLLQNPKFFDWAVMRYGELPPELEY